MSTVPGDGDIETTQILSEGDLEDVGREAEATGVVATENSVETTRVMEDSQLRELVGEPDAAAEAEHRRRLEAERAAKEREAALARVRAHRRQAANTRALRPAGVTPPEAKVALSKDALDMLEREIERSDPPPRHMPARKAMPTPRQGHAGVTNRPPRGTVPIRKQPVPPPAAPPQLDASPARYRQLANALDEIERLLRAGDSEGALAVVTRVRRG